MLIKLSGLSALLLLLVVMTPAYANVTSMSLEKGFYTTDESFKLIGTQDGKETVFIIIRDAGGNFKGMLSDPSPDQGEFTAIPRPVPNFFTSEGIYNATAFVDSQKEEEGFTIKLEFDGKKLFEVPDFVLELKSIANRSVEVEKTISFTAGLIDSSITDVVFSLEGEPTGATIDSSTGKFVWTPTKSQGNIQDVFYTFDIVVNKGSQEDREKITITVKKAYEEPAPKPKQTIPEPEPEPLQIPASFVDETKDPQSYVDRYNNEASYKKWFDDNFSEYESIYQAVGIEEPLQIPASFVDETKDPQSYVDRYNNEASYKKWFDDNFSEYESIYQAVGIEEPKELAAFVDPNLDPQYYIDRYNREDTYKKWFDKTYPDITIYDAVGIQEPVIEEPVMDEPESGECGEGTDLVDGVCVIIDNSGGGGCLIATATYGTEMAPQVQLLREIRDNQLMNTESGASFMSGFNQIYYSFSPTIADIERENPVFREAVKIGITPLLSSLSILSFAESESEVLGYGIGVIMMNIGLYFVAPAIIILKSRKYMKI
ncbi:Ig domain-containing protein [Nitrosopumilus sp. b3]|uniref:Ig domain-containing protein n=1 Tax=Nitrosopumilus sp. b3 TaxID=2109909 RepID=UPI002107A779|nr:Ig domain-containing protein [Nitrosopumilus sp. b3]